jgi:uncharacterized YigZ family protein
MSDNHSNVENNTNGQIAHYQLPRYKTVRRDALDEVVIKKSRFIGHARPVHSEEEAVAFIEEIKKQHWNATHNCSAYIVGERDQWQKASDDGEPSGTAGKPMLEVLKKQGVKDTAVVVTRYFGGILLGAGGLVRAYTEGTVVGLAAAQVITQVLHQEVLVDVDYTWYGKLDNEFRNRDVRLGEILFTDRVTITCLPEVGETESFIEWITDITSGQAEIMTGDTQYYIEGEK